MQGDGRKTETETMNLFLYTKYADYLFEMVKLTNAISKISMQTRKYSMFFRKYILYIININKQSGWGNPDGRENLEYEKESFCIDNGSSNGTFNDCVC